MMHRHWPYAARVGILVAAYFGSGKLGLLLADVYGNVTPVWPTTGIALAAILLGGYHLWPGIALGAFLVNASTGVPLAAVFGIAVGNTLEAVSGAYLLHRVIGFRNPPERFQDVLGFALLAAGLSTMLSASIGVASLGLAGVIPWTDYGAAWRVWWLGDAMGALVVAPMLYLTRQGWPRISGRRLRFAAEAGALLLCLVTASRLIFSGWIAALSAHYLLPYAVFPFFMWAAVRFGQYGAATATFVASGMAIWGTVQGLGPFTGGTLTERLTQLQIFMAVAAVTFQVLAVAITERNRLVVALRQEAERLQTLSHRLVEVQEAERRHLALELHDQVGQVLTGLKITLEINARGGCTGEAKTSLGEAQALVDGLIAQVQDMALQLRPTMLDDLGLLPTLLWHLDQYTAQTNMRVTLKHSGLDRRFAPELETAAYRIVQEALTNAARHARASDVTVRLWSTQDTFCIQIEDQGQGFDVGATLAAGTSSGLAGMRERTALLGGQLTVESASGAGARVTAEFPLDSRVETRKKRT
jgi:signal transduction histidine kinase